VRVRVFELRVAATGSSRDCLRLVNFEVHGIWGKEFQFAYIQSVGSQGAHGPAVQDGFAGFAGFAAAAWCLHPRVYTDAQKAELGTA